MSRNNTYALLGLLCLLAASARAQDLEIAVSPSPVGSGARAAGMADAFVAIADDATAASWNPAGLTQLERPEISMVGSWNGLWETFTAENHPEVASSHSASNMDLNYFSVVWPFRRQILGRHVVASLNYQRKYDFSRDFSVNYRLPSAVLWLDTKMDFKQDGGLSTITPALAVALTPRLSLGVALNLWRSTPFAENSWEQVTRQDIFASMGPVATRVTSDQKEEYRDFSGENATFGLLFRVDDHWTLGARYDTAFTGEVDYKRFGWGLDSYILPVTNASWTAPILYSSNAATSALRVREKRHVRFPASVALGTACRVNDRLTLSLDVTRTDWNEFYLKDARGNRFSLVDASNRGNPFGRADFDPTYTVRFGAEYVCIPKQLGPELDRLWTFRGGLFFDQEPASGVDNSVRFPLSKPSGNPDDFYGFALGVGLLANQRVNIDLAYQFRYGAEVNRDFLRGVNGFNEHLRQHRVLLSTVIYF